MGVDTRKPPLPAPTDPSTLSEATAESVAPTDLATDLSRRTDRTSYSVPEDGSPVTISTRKKRGERRKENESTLTRATHNSQTSLLIEYFEGGKGGKTIQSRPSVRVKVTPSAARKIKDTNDHIQISETSKSRKPSYTRRISLGPNAPGEKLITESGDDKSLSSYASATEESNLTSRNPPIEIEVMHKDHGSPLSATSRDARYTYAHASDISSMPPDSFLDGHDGSRTPRRRRSRSLNRDEVVIKTDTLKTPSRRRSRSLSRERITQKVIEKIVRPRETSGKHKHSNSRSRSASKEHVFESTKSPRRRSSRSHREEEFTSGAESSLLTTSQLSGSRKSGDQYSFRSGTSKSSINNPKLLETVEDAIRRLILPELTALKHEQSQHGRSKHEKGNRDSFVTTSSVSEDQSRPHLTKVSSASDVAAKPKVVLNRSDHDPGMTLSGNSVKGRKERHEQRRDSTSERSFSYDRDVSEDTVIRDDGKADKKRSKERHSGREAAPRVTSGGSLTAAALKSHDSKSSLDRRERRKKRSKSGSRSASVAESEEPYHRGEIPPMPFSSDIHGSELTRDSILSERVEHSHEETSPRGLGNRVREVSRGSPREVLSPASRTPTRTPVQKGLGMHHSNLSRGDLSVHSGQSDRSIRNSGHHKALEAGLAGAGVGAGVAALVDEQNQHHHTLPDYEANLERSYAQRHQNRGLSPIQSVASYRDDGTDPPNRDSFRHTHSTGSLSSLGPEGLEQRRNSEMSIKSLSSARSTNFARSRRPQGINLEKSDGIIPTDVLPGSELMHDERMSKDAGIEQWYDQQHQENDRYRSSMDDDGFRNSTIDVRHMTNYTDDSLDAPYLGNVTAGQQVVDIGANPEYRHTPVAVESAVASLLDASMVDSSRSGKSKVGERAYADSITGGHPEAADYYEGSDRGLTASQRGSPLKQRHNARSLEARSRSGKSLRQEATANSPRLSKGRSMEEQVEHIPMGASGLPVADDPLPEIGHGLSDESDINTNPSIIQGPIGGVQHGSRDHWPYEPTPPQSNGNLLAGGHAHDNQDIKAAELGLLGAAAGAGLGAVGHHQSSLDQEQHDREFQERYSKQANVEDDYERGVNQDVGSRADSYTGGNEMLSPPYKEPKDEGYISAANPRSPGGVTPEPQDKRAQLFGDDGMAGIDDVMGGDDPFVSQSHARHLSGYSHGMPSPLYDSSTGKGIDRIQSKDVVALMDHLTVRDAQRNARDTEILVTLVRSAAEMRNSFEDMKRFIADQDKMIVETTDKNTERSVQKILQGPRPQPLGTPRGPRRTATEEEMIDDLPAKRRNVFRRALKGLGSRSSNDLAKIEDMLVQLLGEVEGLKAAQELRPNGTQPTSLNSYDNVRAGPEGYEPEGQAGTSSTTNQSGYFSNPPSRQTSGMRGYEGRRASDHRISTVDEGDEDLVAHEQPSHDRQFSHDEQLLTPTREVHRGGSVPLDTPPQAYVPTGAQSNDNTPRTEKNRKHKSNSSSIFPKISRWSETTASSVAKNFRSSGRKEKAQSEASRSGSDVVYYGDEQYDPQGDDRIRSTYSLDQDQRPGENRSPSPLIPQGMQEDPKYQAHRNSLLLQHPQPRPGPTHRYQHHLESQAQNFGSPISPASDQWGSIPSLSRFPAGADNRHSGGAGNLSPISDGGYSETSAANQASAPPRPPKVPDEPLVPQRPPKVKANDAKPQYTRSPLSSEHLAAGEQQRYSNGSSGYEQANGSPRSASNQVPRRGPSGPRPITSSGQYAPDRMETVRKNRHRDTRTLGIRDDEDVTF